MAHRTVLTDRQRAALFDLPTVEAEMLHHYTLSDDDLEIIRARRRPHNRFGFALQLCALRYPGRLLTPGEVIPLAVTRFLAAQLGLKPMIWPVTRPVKRPAMSIWRRSESSTATRCFPGEGRAT